MDRTPTARELVVSETIQEADGILGLVLTDPTGADLAPWAPGAHVELTLPSGLVRHYSLCGDPADRSRYRLGILRERDGRGGSEEIHTSDLTGRRLLVGAPVNRFPLVEAERYVFVAGGIGITPLLPMVRHLAGAGAPWSLVYGARTREAMAYVDELSGLTGGDVTLVAQDTEGHPDLDQALKGLQAGTVVYACGPEALLRAVEDRCEQWPARGALHVERFGSAPEQDGTREQGDEEAFEVVLGRTGSTLEVPADRTLLEVVREAVPLVPYSCEEGWCGTCVTGVLDGEPDHRDDVLTDEERDSNAMVMLCVSRCRTGRLTLDL
ncbi:PDR/VanB family oxidoreductase [Streptomyces sp. NBC_01304]|uniref:PDR/VanB family oxidoreductase n=1 Tax=Streptomyces sp. NBC_01304 TaxID=2903818 RepID=UPI002E135445|nr:PDR/VanB family oxidoreductase [Streptomyces sp. NBC_01304]